MSRTARHRNPRPPSPRRASSVQISPSVTVLWGPVSVTATKASSLTTWATVHLCLAPSSSLYLLEREHQYQYQHQLQLQLQLPSAEPRSGCSSATSGRLSVSFHLGLEPARTRAAFQERMEQAAGGCPLMTTDRRSDLPYRRDELMTTVLHQLQV